MIILDVQPYCSECPDFEADVSKNFGVGLVTCNIYSSELEVVTEKRETTIRCKYRKRCEALKRFLMKESGNIERYEDSSV